MDTTCHSVSQSSVVLTKRFSSWQKNHALYTGFEPVIAPFGRRFTAKLPEGYRRLDEGSTTQTQAHIHLYTAPKLPKEVNRRLEPKPSARVVELPIKVELISKHYKCFVITVILWKHIYWVGSQLLPIYMIAISWAYCKSPRCQQWDSNPLNTNFWHMARSTGREPDGLTTTLRLAGEPNTSLVYSAYKIEQKEHCRLVLCFTRIQGVLKGATRASPRNRLTLLFYLWRAPSDLNRDTPHDATNSFQDYFLANQDQTPICFSTRPEK